MSSLNSFRIIPSIWFFVKFSTCSARLSFLRQSPTSDTDKVSRFSGKPLEDDAGERDAFLFGTGGEVSIVASDTS